MLYRQGPDSCCAIALSSIPLWQCELNFSVSRDSIDMDRDTRHGAWIVTDAWNLPSVELRTAAIKGGNRLRKLTVNSCNNPCFRTGSEAKDGCSLKRRPRWRHSRSCRRMRVRQPVSTWAEGHTFHVSRRIISDAPKMVVPGEFIGTTGQY